MKTREDIVVINSDKGSDVVIRDKQDSIAVLSVDQRQIKIQEQPRTTKNKNSTLNY